MNSVSLVHILEKTISSDKEELKTAQQYLEHGLQQNPLEFIKILSDVLSNPANSPVARMAAGLQLKNTLTAKDLTMKEACQQRWLAFPEETRNYIKANVLKSIGTETNRPSSAAQCVAFITVIELPLDKWQEVIGILCSNIINENSTETLQEASLEALGYICQDIDHQCLLPYSNNILTAIVHGVRRGPTNRHVGLAATNALLNSLEFTKANFEKEMERNYIMEVVCEATQSKDAQIRVAALQCLVKIMSLYYEYMHAYMAQALFPITLEAMKSDIPEVSLQGIEFWSNVCDEEINLAMDETEATELGKPIQVTNYAYAKGALNYLVPILMEKLTQQEELDDEDEWNPCKAASVCLLLLVTCCEKEILPHVVPFVKGNIKNPNWRYRDAALMAFGSMLRGIEPNHLQPFVETALPTIIELMGDPSISVRDTAAWTVGQICENLPEVATNPMYLESLLHAMVLDLKSEPRVAANVCWAFVELAKASYAMAMHNNNDEPDTYCLSQYFSLLVEGLLEVTNRPDGNQAKLRLAAYEALMEMIKNSPRDCYTTVQNTTLIILERLNQMLAMGRQVQNQADRTEMNDIQGLLCATLQSVLSKMTKEDAPKISDQIMTALIQIFMVPGLTGSVQEEALRAVSTLIEKLGTGFLKYMDSFKTFLLAGLQNHADWQVSLAAVGIVADLCRELKCAILPYCDEIMALLLENLGDNTVDRSVKPQILSVLGDVALAIGLPFQKYLDVVLSILSKASQIQVDRTDYDMLDFLNTLRESILSAYSAIIQGMCAENSTSPIESHLGFILAFIKTVATDEDLNDETIGACVALLGDLCTTFGEKILPKLDMNVTHKILQQARRSSVSQTKKYGQWVTLELKKLSTPAMINSG